MTKQEYEARMSELYFNRNLQQINKLALKCTAKDVYIASLEAENAALTLLHTQATDEMLKMQNRVHELEAENAKLEAMLEKGALVLHEYPAEKPPESGIEYLVLIDGEIPRLAVYGHHVLYEDDTMNKWYSDEGPAKDPTPYGETEITHWAYLPAPPRDEE